MRPYPAVFEKVNDRWEVCVTVSDSGQFQQVSFVNGICTMKGGTHVNAVADEIAGKILEKIKKKEKSCKNLKPAHVKNHLWVFVNALIENPAFDSQTKAREERGGEGRVPKVQNTKIQNSSFCCTYNSPLT